MNLKYKKIEFKTLLVSVTNYEPKLVNVLWCPDYHSFH